MPADLKLLRWGGVLILSYATPAENKSGEDSQRAAHTGNASTFDDSSHSLVCLSDMLVPGLMSTAKQDVEHLLNKLPDNSSVEDIQYHLYVLDKVRRGLDDARANGTLSQEEVEARLSKWLAE
jgi:hypothetical protein